MGNCNSKREGQGYINIKKINKVVEVARELGYTVELGDVSCRNSQWVNIKSPNGNNCLQYFWDKVDGKKPAYCNSNYYDGNNCEHINPCRLKPQCCPSLAKRIFGCGCCCGCKR